MGVGVMVREVIARHDYCYRPDGDYLGHGAYMLLSNDMLYSHSGGTQNGVASLKIRPKEQDVIKVKYEKGRVTFTHRLMEERMQV